MDSISSSPLLSFVCVLSQSVVSDSATSWTVAHQLPLSMGFSRQEYWSRLSFLPPGGSSWLRDQTRVSWVSCIVGGFFTAEPLGWCHLLDTESTSCPEVMLYGILWGWRGHFISPPSVIFLKAWLTKKVSPFPVLTTAGVFCDHYPLEPLQSGAVWPQLSTLSRCQHVDWKPPANRPELCLR